MKTGANRTDQNTIARMHKEGEDAESISHSLQIEIAVVKAFLPKAKESVAKESTGKSKSKLADKFDS